MGNRAVCGGTVAQACVDDCARLHLDREARGLDDPMYDPAGAVFDGTLASLRTLDREMLRFAGSANLSAVRWLLALGANALAKDKNGTSALHAACRSGSLAVVRDLVHLSLPLDASDCGGWTPLHVASVMGRRDVALCLLQAGAPLGSPNLKGQTPAAMCSDPRTAEVLVAFAKIREAAASGQEQVPAVPGLEIGQHTSCDPAPQSEPFFLPRSALFADEPNVERYRALGVELFSRSPGHGLAFLVASGAVADHPSDISAFLLERKADQAQLGNFLGEDFSLAQTLRLGFINSVELENTGVVGGLARAFASIRAPTDLRKVDRLVSDVAQLWWRHHDPDEIEEAAYAQRPRRGNAVQCGEPVGLELRQCLEGPESLHRLMFSAMLLYSNLHLGGSTGLPPISLTQWMDLNGGIGYDGRDVPVSLQQLIYRTVEEGSFPQLLLEHLGEGAGDPPLGHLACDEGLVPHTYGTLEGWARIPRGGVGHSEPNTRGSAPPFHSMLLSEEVYDQGVPYSARPASESGDAVWLRLCFSQVLLLWASPKDPSPYAFLRLRDAVARDVDPGSRSLVLAGRRRAGLLGKEGSGPFGDSDVSPLSLCFLLPDGRFQPFDVQWLELQLDAATDFQAWVSCLGAARNGPNAPVASTAKPGLSPGAEADDLSTTVSEPTTPSGRG